MVLPEPDDDGNQPTLKFINHHNMLQCPCVIYADTEALIKKIDGVKSQQTNRDSQHVPCGFGYVVVRSDGVMTSQCFYPGADAMDVFFDKLKDEEKKIQSALTNPTPMDLTKDQEKMFRETEDCWICKKKLDDRVNDHDHITGDFRGAAHNDCNIKLRIYPYKQHIPMVFHNLKGYDSHHLIGAIGKTDVETVTYTDKDGVCKSYAGYADDVTLYSTSEEWLKRSLPIISAELGDWSLTVNETKTEFLHLTSTSDSWRSSRQLGSLIGDSEDLERRKDLASSAYGRMYSLWLRRGKVSEQRRIRLYNALVLPVLLYNCGAWGLTAAQAESLNVFHRKQLRRLIGIVYPARISNTELYERCNTEPLSDIVDRRRWQLTGHILRMDRDAPPWIALTGYFAGDAKAGRGRPRTSIATRITSDLQRRNIDLKRSSQLGNVRAIALDKPTWRNLADNP